MNFEWGKEEFVNIPANIYFLLNRNDGIVYLDGEKVLLVKIGHRDSQSYFYKDSVIRRKKPEEQEILHV